LAALETTGFQMIAAQLKTVLSKNGGLFGMMEGDDKNPNMLQKLLKDNEEIRRNLAELLDRGITMAGTDGNNKSTFRATNVFNYGFTKPAAPMPDFDGSIQRGISYRFDGSILNVTDKEGHPLT
jgi:hypothetical protein